MIKLWIFFSISISFVLGLPNVIVLLADDLGYGDLSVHPFTSNLKIHTPSLEMMASRSVIMTNFHVAAPICTPSRAAIMTGLLPYRLGISNIFGTGPQANDHLAVTANAPLFFASNGYYTAHVGKWHLGGMTPKDMKSRNVNNNASCNNIIPGINQHGFIEYVAMQEGPGSPRLHVMLPKKKLYKDGSNHLYRNDKVLKKSNRNLSYKQGDEAIRIIKESDKKDLPFYLHVWFDAPHKPLEAIPPHSNHFYDSNSNGNSNDNGNGNGKYTLTDGQKYETMVQSMDAQVGRIINTLDTLGITNNTIVVFLSDNGPENGVGSAGKYRGRKRSVHEGGIKIPCLWMWEGKFKAFISDEFAMSTDLFPTFVEAAGLSFSNNDLPKYNINNNIDNVIESDIDNSRKINNLQPQHLQLDGTSIYAHLKDGNINNNQQQQHERNSNIRPIRNNRSINSLIIKHRIVTWYTSGGAVYDQSTGAKVVINGGKRQLFNVHKDEYEKYNLWDNHHDVTEFIDSNKQKQLEDFLKTYIEDGDLAYKKYKKTLPFINFDNNFCDFSLFDEKSVYNNYNNSNINGRSSSSGSGSGSGGGNLIHNYTKNNNDNDNDYYAIKKNQYNQLFNIHFDGKLSRSNVNRISGRNSHPALIPPFSYV